MGLAYLPDGRRIDYEDYLKTPEWKSVKADRLAFDNWQCAICHTELNDGYETHHIDYDRLGHEDVEHDIISVCNSCHRRFHNKWSQIKYWKEQGNPYTHWRDYSLKDTARICFETLHYDYMFGGEFNMCDSDTVCKFIDSYYNQNNIPKEIIVNETDIVLYFRNKRYDILLKADKDKEPLDHLLDRMFGPKGIKGGNKKRSAARSFFTKHKVASIKRFYNDNENVLLLMTEVSEIEKLEEQKHD